MELFHISIRRSGGKEQFKTKEINTFARMYRGLVVIFLTISTNAELTLKLISRLSEGAANVQ